VGGIDLRTTTSQKYEAVPRRARFQGSKTVVSLNSRLESNQEEGEAHPESELRTTMASISAADSASRYLQVFY
jgi:hypothetical protein